MGRLNDAVQLYERTLKLVKIKLDPNDPNRLTIMSNLAWAYQAQAWTVSNLGEARAAVALYDQAIAVYQPLVYQAGRRDLHRRDAAPPHGHQ